MEKLKVGEDSLGSPDRRPCFYRIMLFENLTELDIPLEFFNDHLASEKTERVTLRGPCGSWDAKLQRRDDSAYLVQGWQDFVKGHSLGALEFILFLYNGSMSFDVNIYGKNGWQKNYDTPVPECGPSFTSPFPFFRNEMKSYNVGQSCSLLIPKAFMRRNLPMSRQLMVLRDSDGICWSVSVIITSSGHLSLTGGWKDFTDAHSIKKGDTCIFELVEQNLMNVRILRKGVQTPDIAYISFFGYSSLIM